MKFIGFIQEWFDHRISTGLPEEVFEDTDDAIRNLINDQQDCIYTLEKAKENYAFENKLCPKCGCGECVEGISSYEFADIDGNNGIWVTPIVCKNCGEEL